MVQQGEPLAVCGSDIDGRHFGEDLHDAAGACARRDGTVQGGVSVGILPAGSQWSIGRKLNAVVCLSPGPGDPALTGRLTSQPRSQRTLTTSRKPLCTATCRAALRVLFRALAPHPELRSKRAASGWLLMEEEAGPVRYPPAGLTAPRPHAPAGPHPRAA